MNQVNVNNIDVFVDYCHNARHAGPRRLRRELPAQKAGQADLGRISRLGSSPPRVTGATTTCASSGPSRPALRRPRRARGRAPARGRRRGECAELVAEGARAQLEGVRCRQVEVVLDEIEALHHTMARANPGDVVVLCVDKHADVLPSSSS